MEDDRLRQQRMEQQFDRRPAAIRRRQAGGLGNAKHLVRTWRRPGRRIAFEQLSSGSMASAMRDSSVSVASETPLGLMHRTPSALAAVAAARTDELRVHADAARELNHLREQACRGGFRATGGGAPMDSTSIDPASGVARFGHLNLVATRPAAVDRRPASSRACPSSGSWLELAAPILDHVRCSESARPDRVDAETHRTEDGG